MNNNQALPFNGIPGTNNVNQFTINQQFRNQPAFNNNNSNHMQSTNNNTSMQQPFSLLNGHSNPNTADMIGSLMNVNNNNNNHNNNHSNHSNNNNNDTNVNNPLNSAMSNADIETILHLQKQTDQFHEHLSNFINTHLPSLPDTMELMDKLSYDFNQNTNNASNTNHHNTNNASHSNASNTTALPRLDAQDESMIDTLNRDVLHWKTKAVNYQTENKQLREELQKMQSKLNLMENRLIGTRHIALNGGGPRFDGIEFVKYEGDNGGNDVHYKHTKGVDKLKKAIRAQFDKSKWKIEGDEGLYHYFDSILAFLNENEENVVFPQILFPKKHKHKSRNINAKMDIDEDEDDDMDNYDNYHLMAQRDVLEKYRIVNDERVPSLNSQQGVRTKANVPANTVIGQYCGVEYLESEFHKAFIGTRENVQKNIYAFTLTVGAHENNNNRSNAQSSSAPTKKIVIDAHGYESHEENKSLLIYINDCRKDISSKRKTSEDEQYENVIFCKVSLNGWPSIFVITKRAIKQREALLGFYGNDYFDAVQEKQLQETIQNRTRSIIDNSIIQGTVNVDNRHVNLL